MEFKSDTLPVRRRAERFFPQHTRVITKFFQPGRTHRIRNVIDRVLALSDETVEEQLAAVIHEFEHRHRSFRRVLERNARRVQELLPEGAVLSPSRELLLGAYFTHEYSISAAAMFNPSMVPHPDQSGLPEDAVRFIMSFRATGEGHISSIEFRSGVIDARNDISFDQESRFLETPEIVVDRLYEKKLFSLKLQELGALTEISIAVLDRLPESFTFAALDAESRAFSREALGGATPEVLSTMLWLAESNYTVRFHGNLPVSERVLFPVSEAEAKGLEDARFVRFVDDDGLVTYYATYTAYNGLRILPQMIETPDFVTFKVLTLNGRAAQDKGMALFPRRINGLYAMLGRQDGENNYIMFSDNIHFWHEAQLLRTPTYPWELIQVGNNGSPIETPEGWLVLTHGVGPMRKYCLGCMLLDLEEPWRVIGALQQPFLCPNTEEREGYVPNVVYSCGAMLHKGELIVPYAMSDSVAGIATLPLDELLEELVP